MSLATIDLTSVGAFDAIPGFRDLVRLTTPLDLSDTATDAQIQELYQQWGAQPAFVTNEPALAARLGLGEGEKPSSELLNLLRGTGTLDDIGFRTVRGPVVMPSTAVQPIVAGATAGWIIRRVRELVSQHNSGLRFTHPVIAIGSTARECKLPSELLNQSVIDFRAEYGRLPKESELLVAELRKEGFEVIDLSTEGNLEAHIANIAGTHPDVFDRAIFVPTNGNATYVPLDILRFIRNIRPMFDRDTDKSEFFFSQEGSVPLAENHEQWLDQVHFQRPLTVFNGLVRLVHAIHLLNG